MKKTYSEKLKDPRWQKKRLEVMSRDGFKCKYCGCDTRELQIHHTEYKGEPWEQHIDKLETVCHLCHKVIEDFKNNAQPYDNSLIIYSPNMTHLRLYRRDFIHLYQIHNDGVYFLVSMGHEHWTLITKEFNKIIKNGKKVH